METDLNAILSGTATPDPVPDTDTETGTPPDHEREGRFDDEVLDDGWEGGDEPAPPGVKEPSAPPAEDEDASKSVPVKALQEERRKRQELEKRLAEFERQQPQPEGPLDPVRQRLDLSVEYAREQFPDYEDAESAFIEAVQAYPRGRELYQKMLEDRHPARFAYEIGQQLLALREIGDPRTYKQRVMAEAKAATTPPPRPPSLPQTLAASRDSGGRFAPSNSAAPTPLGDILAR